MSAWEEFAATRFDLTSVNVEFSNTRLPIPTGHAGLDKALGGGWHEGVNVIMGAPGTGKSGIALYSAYRCACRGLKVVYYSLEMSALDCWTRLVSAHSVDNPPNFDWPNAPRYAQTPEGVASFLRLSESLAFACPGLLVVSPNTCDAATITQDMVQAACAGADLIVIDYLQYLEVSDTETDYARVTKASHMIQAVSKETRVPIVLVCSMSREGNRLKRPDMHSGAGSGAIEYDATTVTVMWNELDEEGARTGMVLASVDKNRRGPTSSESIQIQPFHSFATYR